MTYDDKLDLPAEAGVDIRGLDYSETQLLLQLLHITGHLIRCHPNDECGGVTTDEIVQHALRLEEILPDDTEEERIRFAMTFSPVVTRFGYARINFTDEDEYQYGIIFSIVVKLWRDTTGLGDAIECRGTFSLIAKYNRSTDFRLHIETHEGGQACDTEPLQNPQLLPVMITVIDNACKEYAKNRQEKFDIVDTD